jgi:nicotinic acid phosphoribosyltransferase
MTRLKRMLAGILAVAALAIGGAAIADAASSNGSTTTTTSMPPAAPQFNGPAHGTAAHEDAEKAVTGTAAAEAQAAAVKQVGSGTAGAVTTDYSGNGYEVTVTKADGSTVEVHLDSSFTALAGPGGGPTAG